MRKQDDTGKQVGNPLWYLFSKTWHYAKGNRHKIVLYWVMFILAEIASLVFYPLATARLVNLMQLQGVTQANISLLIWILMFRFGITMVFWSLHGPARIIEQDNAFKVRANYRKYLLSGVMMLPLEWHAEHHSGDTIDKVEKGTSALFNFSEDTFQVIYSVVQFAISYAMLVYFSRSAAYIVLIMIFVTAWITMRFDKILLGQYKELSRAENNISESVFDSISNITTVIILRVERLVFETIVRKIEKPYELFGRNNRINEFKWFLTEVCCNVTVVLVVGAYLWKNVGSGEKILMGNFFILLGYLEQISGLFFKFTGMYGGILKQKARVLNSEELSEDFKTESFANHVLPSDWQNLEIDKLNFSYSSNGGVNPNLCDMSLSVKRGERIAFVGESGSGKTTLLKIMRDLYHPQSLSLSVDGRKISQGFEGISRAIALVPQDPEIFATTILENITLGAEYDFDFVRKFTDMACFTDVAESLPKGFNSSVNEKGVNLSGGQQQRLALARGFLACSDKAIVLLDEPTSSLDAANEMRIYQNIFREFSGKTIISSVHRLHLLPLFNRIYFFSAGKIIASGDLEEILHSCPEFKGLWEQYNARNCEIVAQEDMYPPICES